MLIYAHRGASGEFPEGTEAAYLAAISQAADGFECDVRLTKDNQIICYHDSDTKRLSNINLKIAGTTLEQLTNSISIYPFDQLLKLAMTNRKDLLIEFKHPVPTAGRIEKLTHKLLKQYKNEIKSSGINITLISFSYFATLRNIFMAKGLYQVGLLINNRFYASIIPTKIAAVDINLLTRYPAIALIYKKRRKKVYVWTVNTESDLKLCEKIGAFAVITNYPARIRKFIE